MEQGRGMERLRFTNVVTPIAYLVLIGFIIVFAHSSMQSEQGLAAYYKAGSEERRLKRQLDMLVAERRELQNKVDRLSDRNLDLDLLDERAREVLGMARVDEMIVR